MSTRINLRPKEVKISSSRIYVEIVAALILIGFVGGVLYVLDMNQKNQITQLKKDIAEKEKALKELEAINQQIEEYKRKTKMLEIKHYTIYKLKENQAGPLELIDELNKKIPDSIWLTKMQTQGSLIALKGQSLALSTIGDFMTNLQRSDLFKNIKLVESKVGKVGKATNREIYSFVINFSYSKMKESSTTKKKKS